MALTKIPSVLFSGLEQLPIYRGLKK